MKQHKDRGIVLSRVDYAERDRILTMLCEKHGKISVLAKGVRAQKSRLAGSIELLSESDITFVDSSRSDLKPLTGARLYRHFDKLARDMPRMQYAFDAIKVINSVADEAAGQEFYPLLVGVFEALDDDSFDRRLVDVWFSLQVLKLSGSAPNLNVEPADGYEFDYDAQAFRAREDAVYRQNDLKILRLCMGSSKPPRLQAEIGSEERLQSLSRSLLKMNVVEV